jgi:hypothetical protein
MEDLNIDVDPDAKREELINDANKAKQEQSDKFANLIESVEAGEEYSASATETVEIGELAAEVKTEIPGTVQDALDYHDHPDPEQRTRTRDLVHALPDIIVKLVDPQEGDITGDEIEAFLVAYYDARGTEMLSEVIKPILEPAGENLNQRVPDGFRQ